MSYRPLRSSELREPTWAAWVVLVIGLLSVAAGIVVVARPSDSLATLAVVLGILILVDGIAALVGAVSGDAENRGTLAVVGVLSVIAALLLIRHPLGGVKAVALVLGIWLIAAGLVRFLLAFGYKSHRLWRSAGALILVVLGVVILANPHIGYTALAWIAGIGFIAYGVAMVVAGWAIHLTHGEDTRVARDASVAT